MRWTSMPTRVGCVAPRCGGSGPRHSARSTGREGGDRGQPSGRGADQQVVVEGFGGCAPGECLAWAGVERERDGGELVGAVLGVLGVAERGVAEERVDG